MLNFSIYFIDSEQKQYYNSDREHFSDNLKGVFIMVGEKIKELRNLKGFSISGLAAKVGISKGYLSDIEKGVKTNPSTEALEKIANALDVNVSDLFEKEPVTDKLDLLEEDMKILFYKAQKLSKEDRQKVLKMMEIFEEENNY